MPLKILCFAIKLIISYSENKIKCYVVVLQYAYRKLDSQSIFISYNCSSFYNRKSREDGSHVD